MGKAATESPFRGAAGAAVPELGGLQAHLGGLDGQVWPLLHDICHDACNVSTRACMTTLLKEEQSDICTSAFRQRHQCILQKRAVEVVVRPFPALHATSRDLA